MSDWHALDDAGVGNRLRIVVHTSVPGGNNNASPAPVPWQTAASQMKVSEGGTTSIVPNLPALEQTDLDNGVLYETLIQVSSSANDTPAQRLTAVQTAAGVEQARVGSTLAKSLQYWGGNGMAT